MAQWGIHIIQNFFLIDVLEVLLSYVLLSTLSCLKLILAFSILGSVQNSLDTEEPDWVCVFSTI